MLARIARVGAGYQASSRLLGRRALATPANSLSSRGSPSAQAVEAAVRGVDDLDRAELVNDASHSIDRALIERMLQSDDQEVAAREWLNEMATGQLHQDFEQYLDWEDAQLAKLRALRAGGAVDAADAAGADAATEREPAAAGAGGESAELAADADADADADAADAAAPRADDGRLLPRIPVEHVNDFPGELLRAELLSPAERLQLETTAAVHAAEGMPFELSEISHRQKERMYELHTQDPVTFSAERMAAMLSFPADHLRAILFLQRDQAERDARDAPAANDDERAAQAKARARQLREELAELALGYDAQFDSLLSRKQLSEQLALGARALRNPSLASAEVAARVYGRQAAADARRGSVDGAELSAALLPFIEWEQRAHHFGRTAPHALRNLAESALLRAGAGGGGGAGRAHPLAELAVPLSGAQPGYKAAVLSKLRKLDSYAHAERRALAAVGRLHDAAAAADGGAAAAGASASAAAEAVASARGGEREGAHAHALAEADFEHPGLSESELVAMLAADAARLRLPELLAPAVAQLLFDAQYFAAEFDLPEEARPEPEAVAALRGARAEAAGFVTLPAALAPFTTLVQSARATPAFRLVDDLGPDADYLSKREVETLRRRAARAAAGDEPGFDAQRAARTIARNRQRRVQGKRQGEYVVIDTTAQHAGAARGRRGKPAGRVHVHERGTTRAGTADEVAEARGYLGFGRRRANRLRFS